MSLEANVNKSLANLTLSDFLHIGYGYMEYHRRADSLSFNPSYHELLPNIRRNKKILWTFHTAAVLTIGYSLYNF